MFDTTYLDEDTGFHVVRGRGVGLRTLDVAQVIYCGVGTSEGTTYCGEWMLREWVSVERNKRESGVVLKNTTGGLQVTRQHSRLLYHTACCTCELVASWMQVSSFNSAVFLVYASMKR